MGCLPPNTFFYVIELDAPTPKSGWIFPFWFHKHSLFIFIFFLLLISNFIFTIHFINLSVGTLKIHRLKHFSGSQFNDFAILILWIFNILLIFTEMRIRQLHRVWNHLRLIINAWLARIILFSFTPSTHFSLCSISTQYSFWAMISIRVWTSRSVFSLILYL